LIDSIQEEELAHLREAQSRQGSTGLFHAGGMLVIGFLTTAMIWLSTWGDSSFMKRELDAAR
jgi:ubiquinone biosynthesis monooxygenase Coq7